MYIVKKCLSGESKSFNTFEECADFIKKEVEQMTYDLYESDSIDKYAVEDILFAIEDYIKKDNGYSHPDIPEEWEIEQVKEVQHDA